MITLWETNLDALKRRLLGSYVFIVRTRNSVYTFSKKGKDVYVESSSWFWKTGKVTKLYSPIEIGKKMKFSFIPEDKNDEDCDGVIQVETTKVINCYYT